MSSRIGHDMGGGPNWADGVLQWRRRRSERVAAIGRISDAIGTDEEDALSLTLFLIFLSGLMNPMPKGNVPLKVEN